MPRPRPYDLDELLAFAESGEYKTAPELMEVLGIDSRHLRSVQKTLNRFIGPRPRRLPAVRKDPLRRRVLNELAKHGVDLLHCSVCERTTTLPMYFRQTKQDDELDSLALVCRWCKRGGDF